MCIPFRRKHWMCRVSLGREWGLLSLEGNLFQEDPGSFCHKQNKTNKIKNSFYLVLLIWGLTEGGVVPVPRVAPELVYGLQQPWVQNQGPLTGAATSGQNRWLLSALQRLWEEGCLYLAPLQRYLRSHRECPSATSSREL